MKGERKLSLVKPAPTPSEAERPSDIEMPEGEAPVSPEELREAEALRAAMDRGDDAFGDLLRAAVSPSGIAGDDLDAILARAMGDADAKPTALEAREADKLRASLAEHDAEREGTLVAGPGARPHRENEAALAVALRAAWAPSQIGTAKNDALVSRALAKQAANDAGTGHPVPAARKEQTEAPAPISLRRFRMGPRVYGAMAAVMAMAAGVLLLVTRVEPTSTPTSVAQAPAAAPQKEHIARIGVRSTTDLFDATTPFPKQGGETARVDRIAGARASDLRANRFAAWGVR